MAGGPWSRGESGPGRAGGAGGPQGLLAAGRWEWTDRRASASRGGLGLGSLASCARAASCPCLGCPGPRGGGEGATASYTFEAGGRGPPRRRRLDPASAPRPLPGSPQTSGRSSPAPHPPGLVAPEAARTSSSPPQHTVLCHPRPLAPGRTVEHLKAITSVFCTHPPHTHLTKATSGKSREGRIQGSVLPSLPLTFWFLHPRAVSAALSDLVAVSHLGDCVLRPGTPGTGCLWLPCAPSPFLVGNRASGFEFKNEDYGSQDSCATQFCH